MSCRCADLFCECLPVPGEDVEKEIFKVHPSLHQTMNTVSTLFNEIVMPPSGRMSLKLIRMGRLKQLQSIRGLVGPVQLSAVIGKSPSQTSDLLSGTASFGEKVARSIEEFAGLPDRWLDVLDENQNSPVQNDVKPGKIGSIRNLKNKPDEHVIPQFNTGGAMGNGLILRDQPGVIQGWVVNSEWIQKNIKSHTGAANLCIVTGFGDSMKGMFNSGDPLVIDIGIKAVDYDAVYFFRVAEEGFIKRLQRIPGEGVRVLSENKKYDSWTIKSGMDFEVFGRVVKAWQGEDF